MKKGNDDEDWLASDDEDEILDPSLGLRQQKVDTEKLLERAADRAAQAGIYKNFSPTHRMIYKNTVEQLEVLSIGSRYLEKSGYWKRKEKLEKELLEKTTEVAKRINLSVKKSKINQQAINEISDDELNFIVEWHKLLMRSISPLFYKHFFVDRI